MTAPDPLDHRAGTFGVASIVSGLVAAALVVLGMLQFARGHSLYGLGWVAAGAGFALVAMGAFHREARWRITALACWAAAIGLFALWWGLK
jgi:hypothetical protein